MLCAFFCRRVFEMAPGIDCSRSNIKRQAHLCEITALCLFVFLAYLAGTSTPGLVRADDTTACYVLSKSNTDDDFCDNPVALAWAFRDGADRTMINRFSCS